MALRTLRITQDDMGAEKNNRNGGVSKFLTKLNIGLNFAMMI